MLCMNNFRKQKHLSDSAKQTDRAKNRTQSKTNPAHIKQPGKSKSTNRKLMPSVRLVANKPRAKSKPAAPRTEAQYLAKPEKFKETWDRVLSVISKMRTNKI